MLMEEKIREELKKVIDPELGVNIVDLGLVYDVRFEGGETEIDLTLTSPGCPLAGVIDSEIKKVLEGVPEIKKLTVELVWDPPWTKEMISEEVRAELGID
jgi:metal-sulfur cluster biosynthetic enzyme